MNWAITASMINKTTLYVAPEIEQGHHFTFAAELYSIGVLLYEMATLSPNIEGLNNDTLFKGFE